MAIRELRYIKRRQRRKQGITHSQEILNGGGGKVVGKILLAFILIFLSQHISHE